MIDEPDQPTPDVVDTIFTYLDRFMDKLHDRVLRPILLAGRFVAYGLILLLLALVVGSSLVIAFVRLSTTYLFDHRVWISYLVISVVSITVGMLIWRKRRPVSLRK